MLENIRFEPGETKNDPELSARLGALADFYVNDAFGAAHRAHASTVGVVEHVDNSAAGRLLQREVETLTGILADPARPLVAIVGGAKVTDKIGVIDAFLEVADTILIGGAMSYPFFQSQGHEVGASLCEAEGVEPAGRALEQGERQAAPAGRPRARQGVLGRHRADRRPTRSTCPRVSWASTSARRPPSSTPPRSRRPARCSGTGRWAPSSWRRSPPARARSPRPSPRRTRSRSSAGETAPRRSPSSGSTTRSRTCRRAAAPRCSCSRARRCPGLEVLE